MVTSEYFPIEGLSVGFEVIEAVWLFKVTAEKIDVLVHPESIVHSLVEFIDGSIIAQLGTPDMCLPIQYALTFPRRVKGIAPGLKLDEIKNLTFEKPTLKPSGHSNWAFRSPRNLEPRPRFLMPQMKLPSSNFSMEE